MSTTARAASRQGGRRTPSSAHLGSLALTLLVWLGGLACAFPLVWTFISSFRPDVSFLTSPFTFNPHDLRIANYQLALAGNASSSGGSLLVGFKNSFVQVTIILATTLFFCPLAGYGFAKFRFRGRRGLFGLMMLTLFFVPITQYIPLLIEMNNLNWVGTYQALVMPLVISSLGIFWMTGVISGVPDELLQAARVDGGGSFTVWLRVVMPVIRPALISLAVVTFLGAYNDFFWPLLILPSPEMQTIQVVLQLFTTALFNSETGSASNWGQVLAASSIVFIPTVAFFLALQGFFVRGMLEGSIKQ